MHRRHYTFQCTERAFHSGLGKFWPQHRCLRLWRKFQSISFSSPPRAFLPPTAATILEHPKHLFLLTSPAPQQDCFLEIVESNKCALPSARARLPPFPSLCFHCHSQLRFSLFPVRQKFPSLCGSDDASSEEEDQTSERSLPSVTHGRKEAPTIPPPSPSVGRGGGGKN